MRAMRRAGVFGRQYLGGWCTSIPMRIRSIKFLPCTTTWINSRTWVSTRDGTKVDFIEKARCLLELGNFAERKHFVGKRRHGVVDPATVVEEAAFTIGPIHSGRSE